MKAATSLLIAGLFCAGAVQAQQSSVTLQMQCRDLGGSGNFMQPNESYVNGMACHAVSPSNAADATTVAQVQPYAPAQTYAYASAPVLRSAGSARTAVALGPSVYIEPMEGLDGFISVAFEKRHVPLAQVVSDAHATYVLHFSWGNENADASKSADKHSGHANGTPSLQLLDRSTGVVVFAYPLNRSNTWHGERAAADAFAGQVKEQLAKR